MCCKTAQDHILCIDDVPVTDRITGFWTVCTHAFAYLLVEINDGALSSAEGKEYPRQAQGSKWPLYASNWVLEGHDAPQSLPHAPKALNLRGNRPVSG